MIDSIKLVDATPYLKIPERLADPFIGQLNMLVQRANELQPPSANEFSKTAAAIHEASHCVVYAREGDILKSARIWQDKTCWLGETIPIAPVDETQEWISPLEEPHRWLSFLRCILAGRRGELLLKRPFCLRAGLDELAYAQIMILMAFPVLKLDKKDYPRLWGTTLSEVDETLLRHKRVVLDLADKLKRKKVLRSHQLADALVDVTPRTEPPAIRQEVPALANDPLA